MPHPTEQGTTLSRHAILEDLPALIVPVAVGNDASFESEARRRLARRAEAKWPYFALALRLRCPIWTEDRDCFGGGVPAWPSDLVKRLGTGGIRRPFELEHRLPPRARWDVRRYAGRRGRSESNASRREPSEVG
ncbi:MAG: hypothetical protein HY329_22305 [Chloroflexi bacterium]|nr:hypothetical protein [Chloroflexota bacterium]